MSAPDPHVPDPEKVARQRFFAIGMLRLSGAFVVMFGFLALMQRLSWVQGDKAKAFGAIMVIVGLIQFVVVPRLLLRMFRGPRP